MLAIDPSTGFSLHPCEAEDIAAITAIYAEAVRYGRASFELDPPDEAEMRRRWITLAEANHPYWVARCAGETIGYAYAGAYRARPAYSSTLESSVYVDARWRGRGVGEALMTRLIEDAQERGGRQLIAVVGDSANLGSLRLHEKVGFERVGTLRSVGWKHGVWLDTVLMQRPLGAGDSAPR
ncbi:GNAT family N-acetyltransferase [Halotalea alkalilenta]|uniref:GNAT family N-acetyltransferase n=1 Tax=Halotalea alkalilenta TaxID=376489 RepID=UPI000A6B5A35|nr:GNAT family N-acetyltransferase [Halotalea alkalilenta]